MSFRLKTILGIAGIEILLLSILVVSGLNYLRVTNEQQLFTRAQTTARLFAAMTSDAVVALDLATLDVLVQQTSNNPDVAYLRIRNRSGNVLVENGDPDILAAPFVEDGGIAAARSDQRVDIAHAIDVGGTNFGRVELGISTESLDVTLADATRWMLGIAGIEILLVGFFSYALGGILTRQLCALRKGARLVAEGNFGYLIAARGNDELADTAYSFNRMSCALAKYAADLEAAKEDAEAGRNRAESVLQDAVESLAQGVLIADADGNVLLRNSAFGRNYPDAAWTIVLATTLDDVTAAVKPFVVGVGDECAKGTIAEIEYAAAPARWTSRLEDGRRILHTQRPLTSGGSVFVETDVTAIFEAQETTRRLEHELMQSQKLEAVGTLAGGIAHEINTPIQYIGDNLHFLKDAAADLLAVADVHHELAVAAESQGLLADWVEKCQIAWDTKDLNFLREETIQAADQSIEGVRQVSRIVLAMKEFSHPARKEMAAIDLNRVLERSAVVCKSEWKHVAELVFDLDPALPQITALEGALNQVALNLLINAAHAIAGKNAGMGCITVRTRRDSDHARIEIADTGTGISPEIRDRIFEPFFTTKGVGRGTGQGLALTYDIVVNKHGGRVDFVSQPGQGTTFIITLPINKSAAKAA